MKKLTLLTAAVLSITFFPVAALAAPQVAMCTEDCSMNMDCGDPGAKMEMCKQDGMHCMEKPNDEGSSASVQPDMNGHVLSDPSVYL